jgi:glycolate oxidase iron-sulfur subunit
VAEKVENIEKFRSDVEQCMKCGFCAYFCPVYREEKMEKGLARGKEMLVRAALRGEQDFTPGFYEAIDNCLLCKTCVQFCPARTRIDHVVTAARADFAAARGLPLWKRLPFRLVLPRRWLFGLLLRVASWFQHVLPGRAGGFRHLPQFLSALGAGRRIPEIAPRFLGSLLPPVSPARGVEVHRVAFFSGCATEYVFPGTGLAMVRILQGLGCTVLFDRRQGCCGAPVYFSGDFETGRALSLGNLEVLEGCDYVVTGCATCGSGLKDYPVYLARTPEEKERMETFAAKVKDFNEFVVDVLAADRETFELRPEFLGKTATWHDPCHLSRHQELREQPRKILEGLVGLTYAEMPNADRCCGLGGSFSISHYEVSKKISDHKVQGIEATKADFVVTACPGCIIQLRDALARHKKDIPVYHIGELFQVRT